MVLTLWLYVLLHCFRITYPPRRVVRYYVISIHSVYPLCYDNTDCKVIYLLKIKRINVINLIPVFLPAFCIRFSYRFIRVTWVPKKTYWPGCATRAVAYGRCGPNTVGCATGACSISIITASSLQIAWASATGNANIVFGGAVGADTPVCDVRARALPSPPPYSDEVVGMNLSRVPVESLAQWLANKNIDSGKRGSNKKRAVLRGSRTTQMCAEKNEILVEGRVTRYRVECERLDGRGVRGVVEGQCERTRSAVRRPREGDRR